MVLTSNGTRELSDALRRRCLYHYVDFPDVDREAKIIITRTPDIDTALALQVARMVASVRKRIYTKFPALRKRSIGRRRWQDLKSMIYVRSRKPCMKPCCVCSRRAKIAAASRVK